MTARGWRAQIDAASDPNYRLAAMTTKTNSSEPAAKGQGGDRIAGCRPADAEDLHHILDTGKPLNTITKRRLVRLRRLWTDQRQPFASPAKMQARSNR